MSVPGGSKPIEELRAGDEVLAFDAGGSVVAARVKFTYGVEKTSYYVIQAGGSKASVTSEHPFYVGGNSFKKARELRPGEVVYLLEAGELRPHAITAVTRADSPVKVYNLGVFEPHTFFAAGFAVHNKPPTQGPLLLGRDAVTPFMSSLACKLLGWC